MKHEITVPEVGESISEVVIAEWLKKDGEYVETDEVICEIESDKASFEVPADKAGMLETWAEEGDTVGVGEVLAVVDTDKEAPTAEEPAEDRSEEKETEGPEEKVTEPSGGVESRQEEIRVSPVASNILKEAGISPDEVDGTGVDNKITKADAQRAVDSRKTETKEQPSHSAEEPVTDRQPEQKDRPAPGPEPSLEPESDRSVERKRMSTLRQTIADRLVSAKNETAMLTTFNEFDMSSVIEFRNQYKEQFEEKHNIRLGFMSFFVKACSVAIQDFPVINARLDENEIVFHKYVDIGIAVSTDRGLVVPVIRNANRLSFAGIEKETNRLATQARENQLPIEEMRGGTFTITNGGIFGSLLSTPILNTPQSAILGMHKIEERPVAIDGEVEVRPMMYVAMSYDHRIIDGKDSVQFLVRVKELIEDPARMLVDV